MLNLVDPADDLDFAFFLKVGNDLTFLSNALDSQLHIEFRYLFDEPWI